MEIKRVCALYFSATGNTEKVTCTLAEILAHELKVPLERFPFIRPLEREKEYYFTEDDLLVIGAPTYAGKLPNKILPDFKAQLHGDRTLAVAVVTFGNRSYDNALAELCAVLKSDGFHTVAGGAFVGRHAFTNLLADGRPDWNDREEINMYALSIVEKVKHLIDLSIPVRVPGNADAAYYIPKGTDGEAVSFLKAKPLTDLSKCTNCGACARLCPMGSIDLKDASCISGICIKCQACVRKCTHHAKYFADPAFLAHVGMLEQAFQEPKKNEVFL